MTHDDASDLDMFLPTWPGAASVYSKLMMLAQRIQREEYAAQRARDKRKSFRFVPNAEGLEISAAMGRGNEEECKALLARPFYVAGKYTQL